MNRNLIKTAGITVMSLLMSFFLTSTLFAGSGGLTYQWYKNGKAIPGATSASYSINGITESDFAEYSVVVSNEYGETTSYPVYLTQGESGLPLYYQWYKDGKAIPDATETSYTIPSVTTADAGNYHVIVSNDFGSVKSDEATLTVSDDDIDVLTITTQPQSQTVNENDPVTFTVTATGTELTYQWYKDGKAISGATDSGYTISRAEKNNEGVYYVVVSNSTGSVISSTAILRVLTGENAVLFYRYGFDTTYEDHGRLMSPESVSGADATLYGSAKIQNGYLSLDGTGDTYSFTDGCFVALPPEIIASFTSFSVEMWARANADNGAWMRLFDFGNCDTYEDNTIANGRNYTMMTWASDKNDLRDGVRLDGVEQIVTAPVLPIGDGIFHHIVYVYDDQKKMGYIYSDGVQTGEAPQEFNPTQWGGCPNMWIGKSQYSTDPYFVGDFDEFRIYKGVLSAAEVKNNYIQGPETLKPVPLTITLNDTKMYDGTVLVSSYTKATVSGLKDGDYLTGGTFASASANVGNYSYPNGVNISTPFTTAQGISNYTVTYIVNQSITPASLSILLSDSKAYDGTALVSSYTKATASGLMAGDRLTAGAATTADSDIGNYSYPVNSVISIPFATANGISNYSVSYTVNQSITPAPLTITINDSKEYDGKVLVSGYTKATARGLIAGDRLVSGAFTSASADVGTYSYPTSSAISTSFDTAKGIYNYTVTYIVNQTINPKSVTGSAMINLKSQNPVTYGASCGGNLVGMKVGNEITGALIYNGQVIARQPFALSAKGVGTGLLKGELITTDMVPAGQVVTLQLEAYDQGYLDHPESGDYYYGISKPFTYQTGNSENEAIIAGAQLVFEAFTVEYTPAETENVAIRSYIAKSMNSAEVTLQVTPKADVSVYFVEEQLPAGQNYTISNISNSGKYIENRNMIRWSFLDGTPRDISYVLTVSENYSGTISFSGEVTFDETTVAIMGIREITFPFLPQTHPADTNDDFEISTPEVSLYAVAWTRGQDWSREPFDIPVTYVARAAMIWVNGGYYTYDDSENEPACWVSSTVKPASVELAADSVNVRTITVLDGKADVSLEVIPASEISVYFVEEQLPTGMNLNVTSISDGGRYVEARGLIRWSFLDAEPRTLTYTIEPEEGFAGVIPVNGEVTFDEETFTTEGDTEANFDPDCTLDHIKIVPNGIVIYVGKTMNSICKAYYSDGTSKSVDPVWEIVSGKDYATINDRGLLTAIAEGDVTIGASYTENEVTCTATIDVEIVGGPVPPEIIIQPVPQTVPEGSDVTFSVEAKGSAPLNYRWYKDGVALQGGTSKSYTIRNVSKSNEGTYTVTVSNIAGVANSQKATLTVMDAGDIISIIPIANSTKVRIDFAGMLQESSDMKNWKDVTDKSPYTTGVWSGKRFYRSYVEVDNNLSIPLSDTVNLDMIWIESGSFIEGSPISELGRFASERQHEVTLTEGYWLGKYEVTQAQYQAVMGKNPSYFKGDDLPVECVSWDDAANFCAKLTEIERAAGRLPAGYEYVLPTEAQWEYACRAGTTSALNNGEDLTDKNQCPNVDEVGWYAYNSGETTHPVGQKQSNAWGLYDMHGNVWEWCWDWSSDYPSTPVTDPDGPKSGEARIKRGGCWESGAFLCRSARRIGYPANTTNQYTGFRVALVPVP